MSKQFKQVTTLLYSQNPQNSFNKLFNVQISVTSRPKIYDVSRTSKPLQNLSNIPIRTQEDQIKKTQTKSPFKQTFQKNPLENKSSIQNLDEKSIPKIIQKGKSPQSRNIKTSEQSLLQSDKQSTQQKQPIQFKNNEPDQLNTNQQNGLKSQQNINQQEVLVQQKQQINLQKLSVQQKSQNNQQQLTRPKTATKSQLQLKQTIQQNQQINSTQKDQLSKITEQTKSQMNLNKKQEQSIKTRQQQIFQRKQSVEEKLLQCPEGCGRSFNENALEKHSKICKKVFQQKRKVFNSQKQRVIEVENSGQGRGWQMKKQVEIQATKLGQKQQQQVKNEKPKWQAQSEAFRALIRQAKGQQLTQEEQVSLNDAMESVQDLVQCKFCNRKFNSEAAKKHIVYCETKAKQCGKSGMQKKKK